MTRSHRALPADRFWIIDGHNVIFAVGALQDMQVSGRGGEARALLVERLEVFAHQRGERVLVVFDGRDGASRADASHRPPLEVVYSRPAEGAADGRILREATRLAGGGTLVTVVTDDVSTLAHRLPRGVRHVRVRDFWLRHIEPPRTADDKPARGDFSDIEREMLAVAAAVEAESRAPETGRAGGPDAPPVSARKAGARCTTGSDATRTVNDARLLRKERGRRRQKRRLERRGEGC